MTTRRPDALPDLAGVLTPLLARVAHRHQPLLVAMAERMAAERYRGWAAALGDPVDSASLRECAAREEEIATRVESLYPDAAVVQHDLAVRHPELVEINRELFAGRELAEQLAIQARGERLGAATWKRFARDDDGDGKARATFLACAELEERSARVLEELLETSR